MKTRTILHAIALALVTTLMSEVSVAQARTSTDTQETGCGQMASDLRSAKDFQKGSAVQTIRQMVEKNVPDDVILSVVQGHISTLDLTPSDVADLAGARASAALLRSLTSGADVYIGWSVLPAKVLRDNYGRHVTDKYFGIDVVIANRTGNSTPAGGTEHAEEPQSLIVTALEFCHVQAGGELRDVSVDPVLVRGSLQKGELTGRRNTISRAIQAIGDVAAPSAGFFKNDLHRGTFSTAAALFTPIKTGFDLVWPDTILTYLENWDKDEVFKKGFVVPAGGSTRGRVFIPIEIIYPRPLAAKNGQLSPDEKKTYESDNELYKQATKGNYDPEDVKKKIGTLVVLGQQITLGPRRRYIRGGETPTQ